MQLYNSEELQIEAIKDWWQKYSRLAVILATLGIFSYIGWQWYQSAQADAQQQAAKAYQELNQALAQQTQDSKTLYQHFIQAHANTIYADLASLSAAAQAVEQEDYNEAKQLLTTVLDRQKSPEIVHIATLRRARIELQLGETEKALATLQMFPAKSDSYKSEIEEIRGDIFLAQGNLDAARTAYQAASAVNPSKESLLLQLKIEDLAVALPQSSEASNETTKP